MRGWLYPDINFHSWQYLVRGWFYRDIIFPFLAIFGEGVIISWHYTFTPGNIWWGGDYIVTLYFHSWQYLVRGWLYRDIILSLLAIFGEGVIISGHCIFTPDNIWWGGDYIVTYFHSWWYLVRGDYIVTLYFHSWQYLVRGWLYRDIIFSFLEIFGEGWLYRDITLSFPTLPYNLALEVIIFEYFHYPNLTLQWYQGFIIHIRIFTPWNLGGWSDYI